MIDNRKFVSPEEALSKALTNLTDFEVEQVSSFAWNRVDYQRFSFELDEHFGSGKLRMLYRWLIILEQIPQSFLDTNGFVMNPNNLVMYYEDDETTLNVEASVAIELAFKSDVFQTALWNFIDQKLRRNPVYEASRFGSRLMHVRKKQG